MESPCTPTVTLTWSEVFTAAFVGIVRQVQNLQKGRRDAHGAATRDGWQLHVEGALGESVVAKHLGHYWNGHFGDLDAKDVGKLQVRTSEGENNRLILHETDPDDDIYVLVVGSPPRYRIAGWIKGRDGKQNAYWTDPRGNRPAYFVPRHALRPMSEIRVEA